MASGTDDFERPDAATLGANWVAYTQGFGIASGAAVPSGTSTHAATYVGTGKPTTGNHHMALTQGNTLGGSFKGPCVRMPTFPTTGTVDGTTVGAYYLAIVSGTTNTAVSIRRKEPNVTTLTTLATGTLTTALADGDVLDIKADGNVLTVLQNGTQVLTFTDTSGVVPNTQTGVGIYTSGPTANTQRWGSSAFGDVTTTTTDTTVPTVPTNVTATVQNQTVTLSWTASTDVVGVTGYRVNRDGSTLVQSLTGTSYTDANVAAGSHSYTVQAFDAAGNVSAASAAASATVAAPPADPPPSTPTTPAVGGAVTATSGGPWFVVDSELSSIPMTGAAWTRVTARAAAAWGAGTLAAIDQTVPADALNGAIVWRRKNLAGTNDTALRQKVWDAILDHPGTETTAVQPLNPFRTIATVIEAAVLSGLPRTTPCPNAGGITFEAWVASLPNKVIPGQVNWNTLVKCAQTSGNNWGFCARPSLYACYLYLGDTAGQARVEGWFRRSLGDLTFPNTFTPSGDFVRDPSWATGNYPTGQGVIDPVNHQNVEDAPRGTPAPNLTGAGVKYSMESIDSMFSFSIMALHNGKQSLTWGNNALRANIAAIKSQGGWPGEHQFWDLAPLANKVYASALPVTALDGYSRRQIPTTTDWLTSAGSTWLAAATTDPGGGTTTPVVTNPTATLTLTLAAQALTLTADASTSTAGSAAITKAVFAWGDGTANTTVTTAPFRALHTYATGGTKTVVVTLTAADAGSDTDTKTFNVPAASTPGAPVANLTATPVPARGRAPLTVTFDTTGSSGAPGTSNAITRAIDFGDGLATQGIPVTTTHTYAALADATLYPATYVAKLTVTDTVTGQTATATVPVTLDVPVAQSDYLIVDSFVNVDGTRIPIQGASASPAAVMGRSFNATTGTWPARVGSNPHMWVGGTTQPPEFAEGDVWIGRA